MTVLLTLTSAGTDSGPFDLYTDLDGFAVPFEVGITRNALLAGHLTILVPNNTLIVRAKSEGICINYLDIVLSYPTTTTTTSVAPSTTTTTTTSIGPVFVNPVSVTPISGTSISLSWPAAIIGASPLDYYEVYVNGVPTAQTSDLFYTLIGLLPETIYTIIVRVVDTNTLFDDSLPTVTSTNKTQSITISSVPEPCGGAVNGPAYWNGTPNPSEGALPGVGASVWSDAAGLVPFVAVAGQYLVKTAVSGIYGSIAIDGGSIVTVSILCI